MRKLLIALGVVVALVIAADRVLPVIAAGRVADKIQQAGELPTRPRVAIHGVPFLTQMFGGTYEDVELTADDVTIGDFGGITAKIHLRGLRAPLGDLLGGDLDRIPVDRATGVATISYEDLAAASGVDGLRLGWDGTNPTVGADLPGAGEVTARAGVKLDGERLTITAEDINTGGLGLAGDLLSQAAGLLGYSLNLSDLPFGILVTDVDAGPDGITLRGQADDLVLTP